MRAKGSGRAALAALVIGAGAMIANAGEEDWSAARVWDTQMLDAIRLSFPRPPVHGRNLYHVSAAMYDAWAAYDETARGVFFFEKHTARDVDAARHEAISYAAYRVLKFRFQEDSGPDFKITQAALDAQLIELGYDPENTSTVGDTPSAIGNRIAELITVGQGTDGSNEANDFEPNNGYEPINDELVFKLPGTGPMEFPNNWQPLAFDFLVLQNGIVIGESIQEFICPHWGGVTPFSLREDQRDALTQVHLDPGTPPLLDSQTFKDEAIELIDLSSRLDPALDEMMNASPGAIGNNPLGTDDGTGHPINPITGEPYEDNFMKVADYGRLLAEFWADGPDSETPPGHWHVVANEVSDTPGFEKRIAGEGPIVDDLEWDVKVYLALSGANHDAAVAAWGCKGYYDYSRPISHIRHMAELGQSGDPDGPNYDPNGLPLVEGLIEIVTEEDILPGGKCEECPTIIYDPVSGNPIGLDDKVGQVMVKGWIGGFNAGAVTTDVSVGAAMPGHGWRCDDAWEMGIFSTGSADTPGAQNPGCSAPTEIVINEIRLAQPGPDVDEYAELAGPAGSSLDGIWYVVLGDEGVTGVPSAQGRVQVAIDLTGHTIGDDGIFLIAESTFTLGAEVDLEASLNFHDIENTTHLLVTNFNGVIGFDCDFFDTGNLLTQPWDTIVGGIGIRADLTTDVGLYVDDEFGPDQAKEQVFGIGWTLGELWMPYQASNFVTPPFAGYVSGHSTFSRAAAEAMTIMTGSAYFPGGLGYYEFPAHEWLKFEDGPSETVQVQWATYYDAADEAAISRRWGGIHPIADDLPARIMGATAGICATQKALALYQGLYASPDIDCDGTVGGADLGLLLGSWGACDENCPADFNGDGQVDGADIGILLGQWG